MNWPQPSKSGAKEDDIFAKFQYLAEDSRLYLVGDAQQHERTKKMLKIIDNALFWHGLAKYVYCTRSQTL